MRQRWTRNGHRRCLKAGSSSAVVYGGVRDRAWMMGRDPSSFLAAPGEAGSGVFSGEESAAGCWRPFSGACSAVEEKPMGLPGAGRTHRGWWHPLRSPSPARQTARVGQQDPSGWMGRAGHAGCWW